MFISQVLTGKPINLGSKEFFRIGKPTPLENGESFIY